MVLIALLSGAAALPSAKAPLNQPTPCARQQCSPEQTKSGGNDQPAPVDKRGTEAAPFLVKVLNTPDGPIQTQSAQSKAFEKPAPDWWAPEWSIVWATLLLVVVGLGQLYMFFKQLRYMRDAMTDAKAAADAARISADAAAEQTNLARQEFYAVNRPRLRIRNAELKHGQTAINLPDGIKPVHGIGLIYGEPIECHFTVANVGGTTATIIECDAYLVQTPMTKLTSRPYDGRNPPDIQPLTPNTQIETSAFRRASFIDLAGLSEAMVTSLTAGAEGEHPKSIPKMSLYLIGYVRYGDATGAERRTAFCRLYDITERRFKRLAEPDEDYENEE